jgi:alpha-L-fucosidase
MNTKVSFLKKSLIISLILPMSVATFAQEDNVGERYQWPADPAVKQKLENWQDLKFGMIIHWGLYAVPGIVESWALCSEDWIDRDSTISYDAFKNWYWGLKDTFNPVDFDPAQWANVAKEGGMRYVVFTTKHHDGFNMFDTNETNFKITNGPFRENPRADVAKYVFEAFRKKGFMIGAYFSKPDWHCKYYWWPKYATANRNNNYNVNAYPWRWKMYKQFTFNQIRELMTNYGAIDILWLDGGWVRPLETVNDEVRSWGAPIPAWSQDIEMDKIAGMARETQPGLLIVDRTVHGPYENYRTPEQRIPEKKLDYPWESCVTLGNAWGYMPNDKFKSARQVIHTLIEVAAKGGSLLLGVGPDASGKLLDAQIKPLKEIGQWLDVNGEAIYNTRAMDHYKDDEIFFTRSKEEGEFFAIIRLEENQKIPRWVEWTGNLPPKGSSLRLLGTSSKLKWNTDGKKVTIKLPASFITNGDSMKAFVIAVRYGKS